VTIKGQAIGSTDVIASYTDTSGRMASATVTVTVIYPIVLVHGFNSDPVGAWGPLAAALQTQTGLLPGDYNCNALSIPGDLDFCAVDFCDEGVDGNHVQPSGSCPYGGSLPQWGSFSSFMDEGFALRTMIGNLKSATGADKVTILAHSMGGLASRTYLQVLGASDVYRFITIGTPNAGTPLASLALDTTLTQSQSVALYIAQKLIKAASPSVQGMSDSPVTPDLSRLNILFRNALPASTQYVSIVGQDTSTTDIAEETAAWGALLGLECSPNPTSAVCIDLSARNNTMLGFFANGDLIVPTDSQDLRTAVPVAGPFCRINAAPVEHSPIPLTTSPTETRQVTMFLQLLDLTGVNPCLFP
jgi:pimeloyl-ACP methyl ester carboxylesterase